MPDTRSTTYPDAPPPEAVRELAAQVERAVKTRYEDVPRAAVVVPQAES